MVTTLPGGDRNELAAGDSVGAGRGGDRGGDGRGDPLVELARDDVVRGGVAADQGRYRVRGGQLHALRHGRRPDVERGTEHAGEGQRVVDLVREVAAPRRHHRHVAAGDVRVDLRVGVGQQ